MAGPPVGERIGGYRVAERIGTGGSCEVYEAVHEETGVVVALKLLRAELRADASARAGLIAEARAMNVADLDDAVWLFELVESATWGPVLVLERLRGETLLARTRRGGPMPFGELRPIGAALLRALGGLHARGLLHGALKPSDVFLEGAAARVRLLDWDRAHRVGEAPASGSRSLGLFTFLAPEQIGRARSADGRADQYAAATILFQALTLELPLPARNILLLVERKAREEARRLRTILPDAPPELDAFFATALARDPSARFPSAEEAARVWEAVPEAPR